MQKLCLACRHDALHEVRVNQALVKGKELAQCLAAICLKTDAAPHNEGDIKRERERDVDIYV